MDHYQHPRVFDFNPIGYINFGKINIAKKAVEFLSEK